MAGLLTGMGDYDPPEPRLRENACESLRVVRQQVRQVAEEARRLLDTLDHQGMDEIGAWESGDFTADLRAACDRVEEAAAQYLLDWDEYAA
jgi:hypothetical protein